MRTVNPVDFGPQERLFTQPLRLGEEHSRQADLLRGVDGVVGHGPLSSPKRKFEAYAEARPAVNALVRRFSPPISCSGGNFNMHATRHPPKDDASAIPVNLGDLPEWDLGD